MDKSEMAKQMPEFAARVFALRGKRYMGSGFHYELEKQMGRVMWKVNSHGFSEDYVEMIEELNIKRFIDTLEAAEWSLERDCADPYAKGAPWYKPPKKDEDDV